MTPSAITGIVSPAYIVFQVDEEKLIPEVLLDFLKSDEGLRQINRLARGTVRKALRYDDLGEIDFPNLSLAEQEQLVRRKAKINTNREILLSEITHQEILLAKLKQAILQEAIQGKLTADWRQENPVVESASQLLGRIQQEKQRLIAEKKNHWIPSRPKKFHLRFPIAGHGVDWAIYAKKLDQEARLAVEKLPTFRQVFRFSDLRIFTTMVLFSMVSFIFPNLRIRE